MALAGRGIPQGGGVGFEIFDKQTLGMTDFVQRLNYQRALQGELARSIAELDTVEAARVHLAMPERSLFVAEERRPSASVVLKLRAGAHARARADRRRRAPGGGERRGPTADRRHGRRRERTGADATTRASRTPAAPARGIMTSSARWSRATPTASRACWRACSVPATRWRASRSRSTWRRSRRPRRASTPTRRGAEREAHEGEERARRAGGAGAARPTLTNEAAAGAERPGVGARGHRAQLRDQQGDEPARRGRWGRCGSSRSPSWSTARGRARARRAVRAAAAGGDRPLSRAHQARRRLQRGARRPDRGRERAVPGAGRRSRRPRRPACVAHVGAFSEVLWRVVGWSCCWWW